MTQRFNRPGRASARLQQRCLRDEMIGVLLGLIGAGVGVSYALTALLPTFAVAGVLAAKKLKQRDRTAFERLGRSRL
ncbi:hypothetical protein GNZ12_41785 [Paraburkholderia sp. 1N]|uniref:Uncharacterized protein n=1 Tax=Paraburkholderia solitsugae TaxID=2675748 RepID=A0ABX2C3X4_9BURK|nr:hypothetical protein [Paraburkholderia solitsugae]NPT47717.1 hypothetical protein [Paraburkholderia solitsugae]